MTGYAFDLYPRTDPLGTVITRLTKAQSLKYRGEANGAGVGLISLRGDSDDGQLIDPLGLQYVRVVEDDETVVGGFFLDNGDFAAINEQNTRLLTFTGAGALSYLDREIMWAYTYHPTIGADDPFDRQWRLYAQGFGAGDFLGNSFYRALFEAKGYNGATGYRTVTPRNGEKVETAIPAITIGFDGFEDSDGNPWTVPSGDMTVMVGESLYKVAQRHMQAGLYIEVDPDTFECRAWETANHRRDRTGASFGADVVRFSKGQNIKSDATRAIAPFIRRTSILAVGPDDTAERADGPGDVPWHGSNLPDITDAGALSWLAVTELSRRADAGDTIRLKMRLGADPTNGLYRPWREILEDDLTTVDSGSGQWDWDEQTFPVAALEISLREAGDWDAYAELGASYASMQDRAFQATGVAAHTHPPNPQLCRPSIGTLPTLVLSVEHAEGVGGAPVLTVPSGLTDSALVIAVPSILGQTFPPVSVSWNGEAATLFDSINHPTQGGIALYYILSPAPGAANIDTSGSGHYFGAWLYERVNQADPIAAWASAVGTSGTAAATLAPISGALPIAAMSVDDDDFSNDSVADPTPAAGLTADWAHSFQAGTPGFRDMEYAGGHNDWSASWTLDQSHPWAAFVAAVNGIFSGGDGPPEIVGTDPRASRCDHGHYIEGLPTEETDTDLILRPDGSGGLEWAAPDAPDVPVTASDLTTYMEPLVDYDGHVTINGRGNPVMVEVAF